MLKLIATWFEPVTPSRDCHRSQYAFLFLILAVGAFLRFWGLGNVGLHGDEETMAMAAMGILEVGDPYLPSGMYYPRALLHSYMMAGSVWLLGESEWVLRLPSAIVGSFTGLAAFFMGRRFLAPWFNLAFVTTITLLPEMVEISQTARMYVFFVTCTIWFAACIFRWERNLRFTSLAIALIVLLLGIHFHPLAILAALLFFFPGLTRQSWWQLAQGGVAFGLTVLAFKLHGAWGSARYPQEWERPEAVDPVATASAIDVLSSGNEWLIAVMLLLVVALGLLALMRLSKRSAWRDTGPVLLVACGLLAMVAVHYHLGGILLALGVVFWLRATTLPRSWLLGAIALAVGITAMNIAILHNSGLYPGHKLVGALIGQPDIWPLRRWLEYIPVACLIYGVALLHSVVNFVRGRPLPTHVLFFMVAVAGPFLIMATADSYMAFRYTTGQLPYFLLCTFAGVATTVQIVNNGRSAELSGGREKAMLAVVILVLVNPIALARIANPSYGYFPDHKGAADYIKALEPRPDVILIAEDPLQQTYYLGKVDYFLREIDNARLYSVVRDGRLVDQYTGTEVLGTGSELDALLDQAAGSEVYVLGTGENFVDGRTLFRGRGIVEVLESDRFEVVYEGRDGRTRVWKQVN